MTLIDLDDDAPAAPSRSGSQLRLALLVLGALVLGATIGSLAMHRLSEQDRAEADAGVVSVLVLAQSTPARVGGTGGWGDVIADGRLVEISDSTRAVVVNSGPQPIDLLHLTGHGVQDVNGYQVELSYPKDQPRIAPGTAVALDLDVKVRCGGGSGIRTELQASLTVRTANGAEHVVTVALDAMPWADELQHDVETCQNRATRFGD